MKYTRPYHSLLAIVLLFCLSACSQSNEEWIIGNWEIDTGETEKHFKKPELTLDVDFQKSVPNMAKALSLEITNEVMSLKNATENSNAHLKYSINEDPFQLVVSNPLDLGFIEVTFAREGSHLIQRMVRQYGNIKAEYHFHWRKK